MQAQQEHNIVAPPESDEGHHVQTSPGKGKGVLSRVKHKARKLKDKVKKVTHTSSAAHDDDAAGHNADGADRYNYRAPRKALAHASEDSGDDSADDYSEAEEHEDDLDDTQLRYEQLRSIGALDNQVSGSDAEVHDWTPSMGAYFKNMDDSSPVSMYKSAGPPNALQATPTEYLNYAAADGDDSLEGRPDIDAQLPIKRSSDRQLDEPASVHPSSCDQISVYKEDLSTDRKLGIGYVSGTHHDDVGEAIFPVDSAKPLTSASSIRSPVDGAHEQIYRPVYEPDKFQTSLPSESINAELYGDVLANEAKLHARSKGFERAGDDYPSDQSEKAESNPPATSSKESKLNHPAIFKEENELNPPATSKEESLFKEQAETLVPETENKVSGVEQETFLSEAGNNGEGRKINNTSEGWGKWSTDKLNSAVDTLALKLGGGETITEVENDDPWKAIRKVESYDPENEQGSPFQEGLPFLGENIEKEGVVDSAVVGSVVVIERLQQLKDSVASTLRYGNESQPDAPHMDVSDEHSSSIIGQSRSLKEGELQERRTDVDDEQQMGLVQGLKQRMMSMTGLGSASSEPEQREKKPDAAHVTVTDFSQEASKSGGQKFSDER